jgi:hypothetical protein
MMKTSGASFVVKEQRLYGSWFRTPAVFYLRFNLKGLEINRGINVLGLNKRCLSSYAKILSKQFRLHKNYSTSTSNPINPWTVSGLIDSEGSFTRLRLVRDKRRKLGWRVETRFQLGFHRKDYNVLTQLR